MTGPELLAKRLSVIETCVRELRELSRPEAIATDVREARFVEHTLQLALQAALDAASHIVSDERLGEPSTNRELFDGLERAGWIEAPLAGDATRPDTFLWLRSCVDRFTGRDAVSGLETVTPPIPEREAASVQAGRFPRRLGGQSGAV